MPSNKINLLYIVFMSIITEIHNLVEVSTVKDNNTTNELFSALNIQHDDWKRNLKEYFTIHNHLLSRRKISANLNKINELLKVGNVVNNTENINEVLEKINKIGKFFETFIGKIKYLKENYVSYNKTKENKTKLNTAKYGGTLNTTQLKGNKTTDTIPNDEDDGFWKPSGRRVFRGFRTRIKNFPFIASINFFKKFQCAGSIIKDDLVITAASCLQLSWNNRFFREIPSFISVQIGSDYYEVGGETIDVQEIYFYPSYDPKTLNNNLAIMRLSRKINFKTKTKRVRKIDIDRSPSKWAPKKNHDIVTVLGWGARDSSNIIYGVLQNRLSYSELDYYPVHKCRKHYAKAFIRSKSNFCAGFLLNGGGACNRDAGGPAIIDGILLGVISFGSPICGSADFPTVFTKLGFHAKWIDAILKEEVPHTNKMTTMRPQPFTMPDIITTTIMAIEPLGKTRVLRIPQQYDENDFSSSESNEKAVTQHIEKIELKETKKERLRTERTTVDITTQDVTVKQTTFIFDPSSENDQSSELDVSELNESNDPPPETETEPATRITVFENIEEDQAFKNDIKSLIENLDTTELLNDIMGTETTKDKKGYYNNTRKFNPNELRPYDNDTLTTLNRIESSEHLRLESLPRTYSYDKVSESLLLDVVSEAVEEEIRQARSSNNP